MNYINLVNPVNPVKRCARQGFTIVELLVAMSLLVILLGLSGMVFNTTVAAHRAAGATIDVSRNLRAVTEQLNTDLRGLRTDAPLFFSFNALDTDGDGVLEHYDAVHFFADGDFQTTRQYFDGTADTTIYGNVARIYYGHANSDPIAIPDFDTYNTLSRKTHILTSHAGVLFVFGEIPSITDGSGLIDYTRFLGSFNVDQYTTGNPPKTYTAENALEFNTITLTNWINILNYLDAGSPDNADHFITNCMTDASRPFIDLTDINTLHLLLSQGIVQMQVQWAYTADDLGAQGLFTGVRWWPSDDPAGDSTVDSDFNMMANQFGAYLKLPGGSSDANWFDVISTVSAKRCKTDNGAGGDLYFEDGFYPKALKFTFVLRDSNGIFADGKTFTHIVYLDN